MWTCSDEDIKYLFYDYEDAIREGDQQAVTKIAIQLIGAAYMRWNEAKRMRVDLSEQAEFIQSRIFDDLVYFTSVKSDEYVALMTAFNEEQTSDYINAIQKLVKPLIADMRSQILFQAKQVVNAGSQTA